MSSRARTIHVLAAAVLAIGACSDSDDGAAPEPTSSTDAVTNGQPASTPTATIRDDGGPPDDASELGTWLRRKLTLPALPSFAIPLDAFAGADDRSLAEQLEVPPGLYEGIAVVDARCDAEGEAVAADASGVFRGRDGSGTFESGDEQVVVQGDGSGSYSDGERVITIESDGSGSYVGAGISLEIESDGSGSYDDGERRIEVDSDQSGMYADVDIAVTVDSSGSATYRDARRSLKVSADGAVDVVDGDDDAENAQVIARVLAEGLSLFPPVPHVGPVPEPAAGESCGSVIRLDANVLFDFNADSLRPEATALLDRVGALLVRLDSPPLRVDGHTDSIGTEEYNRDLSQRRAEAVLQALVERGVDAASISTRAFGETQPLVPNEAADGSDDPAARQLNRRVEIVIQEQR